MLAFRRETGHTSQRDRVALLGDRRTWAKLHGRLSPSGNKLYMMIERHCVDIKFCRGFPSAPPLGQTRKSCRDHMGLSRRKCVRLSFFASKNLFKQYQSRIYIAFLSLFRSQKTPFDVGRDLCRVASVTDLLTVVETCIYVTPLNCG